MPVGPAFNQLSCGRRKFAGIIRRLPACAALAPETKHNQRCFPMNHATLYQVLSMYVQACTSSARYASALVYGGLPAKLAERPAADSHAQWQIDIVLHIEDNHLDGVRRARALARQDQLPRDIVRCRKSQLLRIGRGGECEPCGLSIFARHQAAMRQDGHWRIALPLHPEAVHVRTPIRVEADELAWGKLRKLA